MDEWTIWHRFNRLIKDKKVGPILCPDCGTRMVTRVRDHLSDEPVLWCFLCDIFLSPGLDVYDRVRAVVSEHYL